IVGGSSGILRSPSRCAVYAGAMTQWPLSDAVVDMPPGLWIRRGSPPPMFSMHRHDDVESTLLLDAQLRSLFGRQPRTVRCGDIDSRPGGMGWVHVPFSMFLSCGLPEAQTAPLLSAQPLITHAPGLAARIAHMAERWGHEIEGAEPGRPAGGAGIDAADGTDTADGTDGADGTDAADDDATEIALLEIQAAVRRVLRASSRANPEAPADGGGSVPAARLRQVGTMAQYVRDHHRSPIAV